MRKNFFPKAFLLVAIASTAALGCELVVDFDRTKIPSDSSDANTSIPDASNDATTVIDTGAPGNDAGTDAADASADAPEDG